MNLYNIILSILIFVNYLSELLIDILNLRNIKPEIPDEFKEVLDLEHYRKSQQYFKARTRFRIFYLQVITTAWILFLLLDGFSALNQLISSISQYQPLTGMLYVIFIFGVLEIIRIPFSVYSHFVIEEQFGFNKLTPKTFIGDIIKRWFLFGSISAASIYGILEGFYSFGNLAWLYNWLITSSIMLVMMYLVPKLILPLRFKFTPLEDGELKERIIEYTEKQNYPYKGIYTVNASKRTTKANAFFVGFGKTKRIALYDNLLESHNSDEIVSIIAHEIGHNKKRHILINMILQVLLIAILYLAIQYLIVNHNFFLTAFEISTNAYYIGILLLFLIVSYTPLGLLFGWFSSSLSRKFEYQADTFEIKTTGKKEIAISALKKLSKKNLSNLTPHPVKVAVFYTHPPPLKRISHIRQLQLNESE